MIHGSKAPISSAGTHSTISSICQSEKCFVPPRSRIHDEIGPPKMFASGIAKMNHDYLRGSWKRRDDLVTTIAPVAGWGTEAK